MAISYSPSQQKAVYGRGSSLLVSAGAGSGKTSVLVGRLMSYVCDDVRPRGIDEFLVITFTKAAAGELRARIFKSLNEKLGTAPNNTWIRRQIALCRSAKISTIHSFCSNILREYAGVLNIPADFRVADTSECEMIMSNVLERVLDESYDNIENDPDFAYLVDTLTNGRTDAKLSETVRYIFDKLQSHPYPEKWVSEQLEYSYDENDLRETIWGKLLLEESRDTALYWEQRIRDTYAKAQNYPEFFAAYGQCFADLADKLGMFARSCRISWDLAAQYADFSTKAGRVSGYEELKAVRKDCETAMKKVSQQIKFTSAELLYDMRGIKHASDILLKLVLEFNSAYYEEKLRRRIFDYSDLEHLTVKLLVDSESGEKTPAAQEISQRFCEIMVDEYQDVNRVQELIFTALSKDEKNIFCVGDVKQSIYRFRLADPTIFYDKYTSYADFDSADETDNRKIILAENYRSEPGVLDAVNYIFRGIMSEKFGGMPYGDDEALIPGSIYDPIEDRPFSIDIIETQSDDDEDDAVKAQLEAEHTARRIRKLLDDGIEIRDGAQVRKVKPGDIAILLRTMKGKAWRFAKALADLDVPFATDNAGEFFETIEISTVMSYLAVIDNPHQDIPLISALMSPMGGFSSTELAQLRADDRSGDIYSALCKYAETDEKAHRFIDRLNSLRDEATDISVSRFIWRMYSNTGIVAIMGSLNNGDRRIANLMALYEQAKSFEESGYKGLFAFLRYMKSLEDRGDAPVTSAPTTGNAVRIMSFHKSKGLEFPVVFICDLTKRFNLEDASANIIFHQKYGVGLKYRDLTRGIEYKTVQRNAAAQAIIRETKDEELRALYVAMTRAKQKLIITLAYKGVAAQLDKLLPKAEYPIPPEILKSMDNLGSMVLLSAMTRPEMRNLLQEAELDLLPDTPWDISFSDAHEIETTAAASVAEEADISDTEETIFVDPKFTYPYLEEQDLPSKITATELKDLYLSREAASEAQDIAPKLNETLFERPSFIIEERGLNAAERGTAVHLALQRIDFAKCTDIDSVKSEIRKLAQKGYLTDKQAQAVSPSTILNFKRSKLYSRMRRSTRSEREFKFSVLLPARKLTNADSDDEILFQGVIDLWFIENGKITIVDFKTDRVTEAEIPDRAEHYRGQLEGYAMAIKAITGMETGEIILYFVSAGKEFSLI